MRNNLKSNQVIIRVWKPGFNLWDIFRNLKPYSTGHVAIEIPSSSFPDETYFTIRDTIKYNRTIVMFQGDKYACFKNIIYVSELDGIFFANSQVILTDEDKIESPNFSWEAFIRHISSHRNIYQDTESFAPILVQPITMRFFESIICNFGRYINRKKYISAIFRRNFILSSPSLIYDSFILMGRRLPDYSIVLFSLDKEKIEQTFESIFNVMNNKPRSSFSYINPKDLLSSLWRDMMHGYRDLNVPSFKKNTFALGASIALINPAFFMVSSYGLYHLKNFLDDFKIACLGYFSLLVLFFLLRGKMAEALIQQMNNKRKIDLESGLKQTLLSLERDKHEIINCSKLVNDLIYYGDTRGILSQSHLRWIGFRPFDFLFFSLFMLIACAEEFYIDVVDHHDREINRILVRTSIYTAMLALSFIIYVLSLLMAAFIRYCRGDGTLTYPMKVLKDAMMYLEHESMPTLLPINDSFYHSWNVLSDEALYIRRESHGITFFNQYMKMHDKKNEFLTRHELGLSFPEGWSEEFANEQRFFGFKKKIVNLTYQKGHDRNEYPGLLLRDQIRRECEQEDREYLSRVQRIVDRSGVSP